MDTRTAELAYERNERNRMDERDAEDAAFAVTIDQQIAYNWALLAKDHSMIYKLLWDWLDDPIYELAEIYQEYVSINNEAEFGRAVARILEKRMKDISSSEMEKKR
jgi:hypothetical protein